MSSIPTRSREIVHQRDEDRCVRCGVKPTPREWHHRRGRSVVDKHQHAPCNGVTLCKTCHNWVHQHPFEARADGWIVARHLIPCRVPVTVHGETVLLSHDNPHRYVVGDPDE